MISIHDWMRRRMKEATGEPITADEETMDPNDEDFSYYHTKIQGNAKKYLDWFLEEIEGKRLSLVRKGFIVQEVMNALGMNISQYVRITSNIRHAMQKREKATGEQPAGQPQMPATPAPAATGAMGNPSVPQTPAAPAPAPGAVASNPATPQQPAPMGKTNPGQKPPFQPSEKKWAV